MKDSKALRRISVLVVAILLITLSIMSVTFAKYSTTITGSGSIATKTWAFTANDATGTDANKTFTITIDKMAPGDMRTIDVNLQNEGETDADVTFAYVVSEGAPSNMEVIVPTESITVAKESSETKQVSVKWTYTDDDENAYAGKSYTLTLTITAVSHDSGEVA